MQRWFVLILFPLFSLGLGSAAFSEEDIEPSENRNLVLALYDAQLPFPYNRDATIREVESIFGSLGVEIHWRRNDEPVESLAGGQVLYIVFMGSDPSGPGWNLSESTMGVFVHGTGWQRSVYIFASNVARVLGIGPSVDHLLEPGKRRDLSRALGRVIAHELVHAVSPAHPHAEQGLMRSNLGVSFLSKRKVDFDRASRTAFLAGLRRLYPVSAHGF